MSRTLWQTTYEQPLAEHYLRSGGPWDVGPLGEVLEAGPHTLVIDGDLSLTASQVADLAAGLAARLLARGVGPGDVVAWQLPNWHETVLLYRACWQIGAIALPLHHRHREADLVGVLARLQPKVTYASVGAPLTQLRECVLVRASDESLVVSNDEALAERGNVDPAAPAVIMMTSGTTSEPKLVMHSHRSLACKARAKRHVYGFGPGEVLLLPSPMAHINGLVNGVLMPAVAAMTVVLMEQWNPVAGIELIERHSVTFFGGAAAFLTGLIDSPAFRPERVQTLRLVAMGGSSMTPSMLGELGDRLGCEVKRTYGSTEAPSITSAHAGDDPAKGWSTDGRPSGESEVVIVDPATIEKPDGPVFLGPGEVGEVWVRGPEMFIGYVDAADTANAVRDGWFRTGDLGSRDEAGWLTIAGRIKELIIRGGENIVPGEVELRLEAHPSVRRAVAVGYGDRVLGERVAALVEASDDFDLDACRGWFAQQQIAKFKTPELIVRVAAVPLTEAGKPDRAAARDIAERAIAERDA